VFNSVFKFAVRLRIIRLFPFVLIILLACSCSFNVNKEQDGAPTGTTYASSIPDATPKAEPKSRYGNPKSYEVFGKRYYVMNDSKGFVERGIASWYGKKFHGKRTSSGETYDMHAMTAAHKTLPLPTYVEVTNLKNGKKAIVRVNDRGPFHENRIIDLSHAAATKIDIVGSGTGLVQINAIDSVQHAAGQKTEPRPAPVRKVSTGKDERGFYIQVGSFANPDNAESMRRQLDSIDDRLVKIAPAVVEGNTFYRVRIGPLNNIDVADFIVYQLTNLNLLDHRIVVE